MRRLFLFVLLLICIVHFSYTQDRRNKQVKIVIKQMNDSQVRYAGKRIRFKDPPFPNVTAWHREVPHSNSAFTFFIKRRINQRANLPWASDFKWNRYALFNSLPSAGPAYGGKPYLNPADEVIGRYQESLYSYLYPLASSTPQVFNISELEPATVPLTRPSEVLSPKQPIQLGKPLVPQPDRTSMTFIEALQEAHDRFGRGHSTEAARLFRRCVEEQPHNNSAMMGLALAGLESGDYETAAAALEKALTRQKDWLIQPPAFSLSSKKRASLQSALDSLRLKLKQDTPVSYRFLYGYGLYLQGKNRESLAVLQRLRKEDRQYSTAQRLIEKLKADIGEEAAGKP